MNLNHIANPQSRHDELIYQVGQLPLEEARALMIRSLADKYPPIRHLAARTLSDMLDDATIDMLTKLLSLIHI